ncbi:MAG: hypothetical protein WC755_09300 [Candidatus Woesearchaeota archaeon]|jgi:hypothetical protein
MKRIFTVLFLVIIFNFGIVFSSKAQPGWVKVYQFNGNPGSGLHVETSKPFNIQGKIKIKWIISYRFIKDVPPPDYLFTIHTSCDESIQTSPSVSLQLYPEELYDIYIPMTEWFTIEGSQTTFNGSGDYLLDVVYNSDILELSYKIDVYDWREQ